MVPKSAREELDGAERYFDYRERCIFCDIIPQEMATGTADRPGHRPLSSPSFPYASRFPFEAWILPKGHASHFENIQKSPRFRTWVRCMRAVIRKIAKC